jgi:hypothetical protein
LYFLTCGKVFYGRGLSPKIGYIKIEMYFNAF